jgi:hypothetical protein
MPFVGVSTPDKRLINYLINVYGITFTKHGQYEEIRGMTLAFLAADQHFNTKQSSQPEHLIELRTKISSLNTDSCTASCVSWGVALHGDTLATHVLLALFLRTHDDTSK